MKKYVFGGVFVAALLGSVSAQANGITLCFASQVSNVAIIPEIDYVESAVVITDSNNNPTIKADSFYGKDSTVGSYWTSAYPATITLPAGCSTVYFMVKNTPPSTSTQWMCAQPNIANGPTNAAGTAFSVVSGAISGSTSSATMIIPAIPNQAPATVSGCPKGY